MKKEKGPIIYIPPGAKINVENKNDDSPKTKYERRRVIFDIDGVKKIARGRYGRNLE